MLTVIVGSKPWVFLIEDHPAEFDVDEIFKAFNGVEPVPDWLVMAVTVQNQYRVMSMSVGDAIFHTSSQGREFGGLLCADNGWTRIPLRQSNGDCSRHAMMNGGHIFIC